MPTVALLVNPARADARRLGDEVTAWLVAHGHRARVLRVTGVERVTEGDTETDLADVTLDGADLAVSLGGDGTFLRLVPLAWAAKVPVLGVNFGRLGYLLEVSPDQLLGALGRSLTGEVTLDERVVLMVTVTAAGGADASAPGRRWLAFNEIALEKTVYGHTVRLATFIDGEEFLTYSADGLLVATPSGSTAYNLSAGGPVIAAHLRAMVVTPVAPHLTLDRSLVLHPDQTVEVRIRDGRPAVLVVDGREAGRLEPGSVVTCRVAREPVRLVTLAKRGFGSLVQAALRFRDPGRGEPPC
ncbi:MAG TPA: NAD(+)/NADH kinase [Acidimicrobiales bacterium]|nr:NAD(+)/NADH kinase [Acidimicrobiales bacterium]